ncbi:hypothetical protein LSAT2_021350 [Lamellibrachia satsuma]|nr:hypothetical protein LSAT2_021350 [Lamellibrachia satsuma]
MMHALDDSNNDVVVVWMTLYVVWIVACLASNGLLIASIIRQRRQLRDSDVTVLVLSLVVAQMLVGVFVLTASIAGLFYDGSWLCKLHHYTALVSSVTSSASLVGLVVVTRKEAAGSRFSSDRMGCAIGAAWLVALVYATRAAVVNNLVTVEVGSGHVISCTVESRYKAIDNWLSAVDAAFMFLVLSIVLFWVYVVCQTRKVNAIFTATENRDKAQTGHQIEAGESNHAKGTGSGSTSYDAGTTKDSGDNKDGGESNDNWDANDSNNADEASDTTHASDAGNSRNATNTNQADKTGESLDRSDNRGGSDEGHVSESNDTGKASDATHMNAARGVTDVCDASETSDAISVENAGQQDRGRDATDANDNLNSKLHMLIVMVTCFLLTTSAPFAWQVVRFIMDYDTVRDNYRHINRAVHLFSYANPWLNALILLYYRSVFRASPTATHTKVSLTEICPIEAETAA